MTKPCFTCGIQLHQTRPNGSVERSFSTCFADERICEQCESEFERKLLPKRAVGTLAAEWKGHRDVWANAKVKALTTRVRAAKTEFTDGAFTFTPACGCRL